MFYVYYIVHLVGCNKRMYLYLDSKKFVALYNSIHDYVRNHYSCFSSASM